MDDAFLHSFLESIAPFVFPPLSLSRPRPLPDPSFFQPFPKRQARAHSLTRPSQNRKTKNTTHAEPAPTPAAAAKAAVAAAAAAAAATAAATEPAAAAASVAAAAAAAADAPLFEPEWEDEGDDRFLERLDAELAARG